MTPAAAQVGGGHSRPGGASAVACVVLAAGAGTRYGEPKAGAVLGDGSRFVDAVIHTAHRAGIEQVVVVLHPDVAPPPADRVRVVRNPNPLSEQILSLRLGLAQLANTTVRGTLVWPVDYPLVRAESITRLLEMIEIHSPDLAFPVWRGHHGHPVYFGRNLWRELTTEANGGARSVVHRHMEGALQCECDDPGTAQDLDYRSDLTD